MKPSIWWRPVLALVGLAVVAPLAARALAGPPGAIAHVRWQPSLSADARQDLEARFRLADATRIDEGTWRYDLLDPSPSNIRALVQAPAVADTHDIDRSDYSLSPSAIRTDRRQRFAIGSALVTAADRLAITLAVLAALLIAIRMSGRAPSPQAMRLAFARTMRVARSRPPMSANTGRVSSTDEPGSVERPRVWTAVVMIAVAPLVVILWLTVSQTPFPITESVALLEDAAEQSVARVLTPDGPYYRPLWNLTFTALSHTTDLDTTLASVKLLTIVPAVLLVVLLVWHLRPRTALEAGAAAVAVAVFIGSPGFRDNLEIGLFNTIVPMALALITWMVLNHAWRAWHAPLVIACTLLAIGFKEQGLVLVPLVIGAWWAHAPGVNRGVAVTAAGIAMAYVAFRVSTATWSPFESDIGFGFAEFDKGEAAARWGAFPYWMYLYNSASTMANVLFAEPTRGVFQIVLALREGRPQPWQIVHLGSSVALTGVMTWWAILCVRSMAQERWTLETRVLVALVLALLASGALSFNYSRERLAGIAAIFYAIAAFFAVRAAAIRVLHAPRARFAVAAAGLALLAIAWQAREVGTLEYARLHSWGNHREWFIVLPERRLAFGHRPVYQRIMESMIEQGRDAGAPRPTRFPRWLSVVVGQTR